VHNKIYKFKKNQNDLHFKRDGVLSKKMPFKLSKKKSALALFSLLMFPLTFLCVFLENISKFNILAIPTLPNPLRDNFLAPNFSLFSFSGISNSELLLRIEAARTEPSKSTAAIGCLV